MGFEAGLMKIIYLKALLFLAITSTLNYTHGGG